MRENKLQRGSLAEKRITACLDKMRGRKPPLKKATPDTPRYENAGDVPVHYTMTEAAEDTGLDPPIYRPDGAMRDNAVFGPGIRVGERVMPWPTLSLWIKISSLAQAYHAIKAYGASKIAIAQSWMSKDGNPSVAITAREEAINAWRESGVQFEPRNPEDLHAQLVYGLISSLQRAELEEGVDSCPWWRVFKRARILARLKEIARLEDVILLRPIKPWQVEAVNRLWPGEEDGIKIVEEVGRYFEGKKRKKKHRRIA